MFSHQRCFIIGEIAGAHDGSFMFAQAHIDAVAQAGCDAVKFQLHFAEAESTPDEAFRVPIPGYATRQEYWKKTGFPEARWRELARYAEAKGLIFMASAFSIPAVEMLERLEVPVHKVSSGETANLPLIERMAATGKPIILSTGMSGWSEIDTAMARIAAHGVPCALTQCVTQYPTPAERVGLNVMAAYRDRYGGFAGLSDHSGTIFPAVAGAYIGMDVLEVHVRLGANMPGPDAPASLDPAALALLVQGVRFAEVMRGNPVEKDALAREFSPLRELFQQAIYVRVAVAQGEPILESGIEFRKPLKGLPAARWDDVIGRPAARDLTAGCFLQEEDIA